MTNNIVENKEPRKCGELAFFPEGELPANIVPCVADAIRAISQGRYYSEAGW